MGGLGVLVAVVAAVAGADRNDKRMVVLWHIAEDAVRGFQLLPIGH